MCIGIVQIALYALLHLVLTITLPDRYYYNPLFKDEDTKPYID